MGFYASSAPDRRGARVRTLWVEPEPTRLPAVDHDVLSRRPLVRVAARPPRDGADER